MCKLLSFKQHKVNSAAYLLLTLAFIVFFGAVARGADEFAKVPIKVNVLKGVNITDEEIKEIVKEANKILKQAKIAFDDPNISRNVDDEGNNDDEIQAGEDPNLDEAGQKELNDTFGEGKGIKVYITNEIYDNNNINGVAPHVKEDPNGDLQGKPIIYLKNRPDDPNKKKGASLAHESCHVFTLGDKDIVDLEWEGFSPKIETSDSDGHVDDPNNLMYPYAKYEKDGNDVDRGTELTDWQKAEILKGAKRHAKKAKIADKAPKKKDSSAYTVVTLPIIHGGYVDDMGEPGLVTAYSDLGAGFLFAENPISNLEISLLLEGTFPSYDVNMVFTMYFDVDNNDLTGDSYGSATGIDKVLTMQLSGSHPGGPFMANLLDVATGRSIFLPFGSTQTIMKIIDKTEHPYPPEVEDYVGGLYQQVPLQLLNITANEVPIWVTSDNPATGDFDEAGFVWQLFDVNEPAFQLLTTRIEPGQPLDFTGRNFTPDSDVGIFLDDNFIGSTVAQLDGTIDDSILLDSSYYVFDIDDEYYDFFFVTARDAFGKSDFSIVELVPNEADIYADTVVNFKDFAVLANNWLAGY